jgi:hypothetical protein
VTVEYWIVDRSNEVLAAPFRAIDDARSALKRMRKESGLMYAYIIRAHPMHSEARMEQEDMQKMLNAAASSGDGTGKYIWNPHSCSSIDDLVMAYYDDRIVSKAMIVDRIRSLAEEMRAKVMRQRRELRRLNKIQRAWRLGNNANR